MKAVLMMSAILGLSFGMNVKAESIDDQINNAQNFVVIKEPTYNGYRFLSTTATEEAQGESLLASRAANICKLMGLGAPVAYASFYNAKNKQEASDKTTGMYDLIDGNLVLAGYPNGYWSYDRLLGRSAYFGTISCKKKKDE